MDANPTANPFKPRRRWLRFSLRTFLLLITIFCIWLGIKVNAVRQQREAMTAILKVGGTVYFDYQMVSVRSNPNTFKADANAMPTGPAWLRHILGEDYFRNVVEVEFRGELIRGEKGTIISESDFEQLLEFPHLRRIYLNVRITSNGIVSGRPLQDDDLAMLGQLSSIESIYIYDANINGSGLAYLANLKCLSELDLRVTPVNDAGVEHLSKLTKLRYLGLAVTQLTDVGLKHLQNLTNLDTLYLVGTNISDAGLHYLNGLTSLKHLYLGGTHVTADGVRELQKSLPKTKISGP